MDGGRQQPLLKRYTYILGVVAAYWTVSITLVFVNKSLLSGAQKLDAPLFITCYQCVITVAACFVLRYDEHKHNGEDYFNSFLESLLNLGVTN